MTKIKAFHFEYCKITVDFSFFPASIIYHRSILPSQRRTHLKPVPVVNLLSGIRRVRAQCQLYGGGHCKPPSLHAKRHEAGAQHCSPHVHVQVRYMDVWLPGDDHETTTLQVKTVMTSNMKLLSCFSCCLLLSNFMCTGGEIRRHTIRLM